jgi:Ca2+/H+ antiporter, TMEM165/GDT1 family
MFVTELIKTFAVVFPAELPDKTMFTTLVLVTKFHRPKVVWSGVPPASVTPATIAVTAGQLVSLLPQTPVKFAVALLFAVGSVVLWRSADEGGELEDATEVPAVSTRRVWTTSFGLLLVAEWGDLTQLSMASLSARSPSPLAVFVGGLLALWSVAAIAASTGRALVNRVPLSLIRKVAAVIFAGFAVLSVVEAIRG